MQMYEFKNIESTGDCLDLWSYKDLKKKKKKHVLYPEVYNPIRDTDESIEWEDRDLQRMLCEH